jgi:hypothetical protein
MRPIQHQARSYSGDIAVAKAIMFVSILIVLLCGDPFILLCIGAWLISFGYYAAACRAEEVQNLRI